MTKHRAFQVVGLAVAFLSAVPFAEGEGSPPVGPGAAAPARAPNTLPLPAPPRDAVYNPPGAAGPMPARGGAEAPAAVQAYYLVLLRNPYNTGGNLLALSATDGASGTVEIPSIEYLSSFEISAGQTATFAIPLEAMVQGSDSVVPNAAIRVTSDRSVTAILFNATDPGIACNNAYGAIPTSQLGTDYRVLSWPAAPFFGGSASLFAVAAIADATQVTITPSAHACGHMAGVPYSVQLNRGDVYVLEVGRDYCGEDSGDLTGSRVEANQPVAVFGGQPCADVPTINVWYCDHLAEQIPPSGRFGTEYLVPPQPRTVSGRSIVRVVARDDGTDVTVDSTLAAQLDAGAFYEFEAGPDTNIVRGSRPVLVGQYAEGSTREGNPGDPSLTVLPPLNVWRPTYDFFMLDGWPVQYVGFTASAADSAECHINGAAITGWRPVPGLEYAHVDVPVEAGAHRASCPSPFLLTVFAAGADVSYSYSLGDWKDCGPDADSDGFGLECDCDDADPSVHPGATDICDDRDNDCDDRIDEGCDDDSDDYCDASIPTVAAPAVCPHGGGDCDDSNPGTHPGAGEACDFADNNCDSTIDEGFDGDEDGHPSCSDCDPTDPNRWFSCPETNYGRPLGSTITSDPVNVATGNFTDNATDLMVAGPGAPFAFVRNYNSQDAAALTDGPLGFGWTHSYNLSLSSNSDGTYKLRLEDGRIEHYTPRGAGRFDPPEGSRDRLEQNGDGSFSWTRRADRLRFDFDAVGRLTRIVDKNANAIQLQYTGPLLTAVINSAGRTITLTYNADHLETVQDPSSRMVSYAYDASGNLTTVTDVTGGSSHYTYDADHQILTHVDARGNTVVSNAYDTVNRVVSSQSDVFGCPTTFVYDFAAGWTDVTDPLYYTTTFWYDDWKRTTRVRDPLGYELSYTYNAAGDRTSMTDKNGAMTTFDIDYRGNILTRSDPDDAVTSFEYDTSDHVTKKTDPLGFVTSYRYDDNGNLTTATDRMGRAESRSYSSTGQLSALVDRRGKQTTYMYDSQGNLVRETEPAGSVRTHTYDAVGRRLATTNPNGHVTSFAYDNSDHVLTVTDHIGHAKGFTYDANGNKVAATNELGRTTTWTYDEKNRLTKVRDPLGHETSFAYDCNDRKTSETSPRGFLTQFEYDQMGNLTRVTDALNRETLHRYDAMGKRIATRDPGVGEALFTYDVMGRLVSTQDPLGHTTRRTYDRRGDMIRITDALNRTAAQTFDAEQRLTAIVDARGGRTEFTYDEEGHRLTLKNAAGHVTGYTYDDAGRLATESDPVGRTWRHGYDPVGNRVSRTDPTGAETTYAYDELERLVRAIYPNGREDSFRYDAAGNRLSAGAVSFAYNDDDLIVQVTDENGRVLDYSYDQAHNRTAVHYPGGTSVNYGLDAINRITSISDWQGNAAQYTYNAAGDLATVEYPNGSTETLVYDDARRLVQQIDQDNLRFQEIARFDITRDALGNPTHVNWVSPVEGHLADGDEAYTYDDAEQILARGAASYTHDGLGRLIREQDGAAVKTYSYDPNSLLTGVDGSGAHADYEYDADGDRISSLRGGVETRYLLDRVAPMTQTVAEFDAAGNVLAYHVFGHRLLWSISADGIARVYHTDPVGSVVAVTGPDQSVIAAFAYDEFGGAIAVSGDFGTDARFIGSYGVTSEPSGLYFMRARFYDPSSARFMSRDPAEVVGLSSVWANPYPYCSANPVMYVDPNGEWLQVALWVAGRAVVNTVAEYFVQVGQDLASGQKLGQALAVNKEEGKELIAAAVGGVAQGAVEGLTFGLWGGMAAGAAGGFAESFTNEFLEQEHPLDVGSYDWGKIGQETALGAGWGLEGAAFRSLVGLQKYGRLVDKYPLFNRHGNLSNRTIKAAGVRFMFTLAGKAYSALIRAHAPTDQPQEPNVPVYPELGRRLRGECVKNCALAGGAR